MSKLCVCLCTFCHILDLTVEVTTHLHGKGITTLVAFLQDPEVLNRLQVLRLLSVLSLHMGADIVTALRSTNQLVRLKELLQAKGKVLLEEQVAAANLLANIPLTEFEVNNFKKIHQVLMTHFLDPFMRTSDRVHLVWCSIEHGYSFLLRFITVHHHCAQVICVLEVDLLPWSITTLDDVRNGKMGKLPGRLGLAFQEGLAGLLLHFARNSNVGILNVIREERLFKVFQELLSFQQSSAVVKERAALGLQLLATKSTLFMSKDIEEEQQQQKDSGGFFFCCTALFHTEVAEPVHTCLVHRGSNCDPNMNFCLVAGDALVPLVEHLEEEQGQRVREAVLGALSTLLFDESNLRGGVTELLKAGGVQPIIELFCTVQQGELQEKAVWMIERILRTEQYAQGHTIINQGLFQALIEAFKHGSPTTRALAQDSLTHLKQISVVSSGPRGKSRVLQQRCLHQL